MKPAIVSSGTLFLDSRASLSHKTRYTANNFNNTMARNAALTIVEAEEIVPIGSLSPNAIHLPGIYVDRIVPMTVGKQIEFRTLAPDAPTPPPSPGGPAA